MNVMTLSCFPAVRHDRVTEGLLLVFRRERRTRRDPPAGLFAGMRLAQMEPDILSDVPLQSGHLRLFFIPPLLVNLALLVALATLLSATRVRRIKHRLDFLRAHHLSPVILTGAGFNPLYKPRSCFFLAANSSSVMMPFSFSSASLSSSAT